MKRKILIIVTIVTLLIGVMAIPSFAAETHDMPSPSSVPNFNDFEYSYMLYISENYYIFLSNTLMYYDVANDGVTGIVTTNFTQYKYDYDTSSWTFVRTYERGSYVTDLNVVWSSHDIMYGDEVWFEGSKCDGSTCPAIDLNADSICDECGKRLGLRYTGYPTLPHASGSNMHSVVIQREDGYLYMVLTSDIPYTVGGTVGDNFLITVANEQDVSFVAYKCTDGKNWVNSNSGEAYSLSVGAPSSTLLDSTFDWYKDGTIFFQVPLWEKVGTVTQGQIPMFNNRMGGNLMILTLCGVGLLTLLMGSYLLLRMFKRYQH